MQPFVNEVNTLPGSLCLRLWEASGVGAGGAGAAPAGAGRGGARGEDPDALRVPRGDGPRGSETPDESRKVGGACSTTCWFRWPSSSAPSTSSGTSPSGRRGRSSRRCSSRCSLGRKIIDKLSAHAGPAGGPGRRAAEPPQEGGDADHGRRPDPAGGDVGHAAVGAAHQPIHLAGPARDAGHGGRGIRGRLPQGHARQQRGAAPAAEVRLADRDRPRGGGVPVPVPGRRLYHQAGDPLPEALDAGAGHRLRRLRHAGHRGMLQCGQPDRRPGRAGHRPHADGRRHLHPPGLRRGPRRPRAATCRSSSSGGRASFRSSRRRWWGRAWDSSGTTPTRPRCSWATRARWRWAERSPRWP